MTSGQRQYGKAMRHTCSVMQAVVIGLLLAGCVNTNDNWWDENGAVRARDGSLVRGTPLPAPGRYRDVDTSYSAGGGGTHVVKRGETLYQVSRVENVPLRSLIDANNLQPPYDLQVGQKLSIPSSRYHVVKPGDTVYSISRTYGVDMSTLTSTNHVTQPYTIKVGQKLQLPSKVNNQMTASVNEGQRDPAGVPVGRPDNNYVTTTPAAVPAARPVAGVKEPLPPPPVPKGDFVWPAQGKIISTYGPKEGGQHNDGINIAVANGSPVKAAQNGVVAYAGNELKGYGNLLLVRHSNGWMTAYAHNSKLMVKRGDTVMRGQTISLAGSTGSVTSPQVHFEVRKGAKAVDPRTVIGG